MRPHRRLCGDDRGALLVFVAVAIAALLGLIALSFDLGRMASTQTELQSFADNVALAAAAELDGKDDSITRATLAANTLITDQQSFGEGGRLLDVNDFTLTFMSELDPDDRPPYADTILSPPYDVAESRRASLVRVDIIPREVELTFASALFSLTGRDEPNTALGAAAIAGYTQYACGITPMMFCLPSPSYTADANIGDMIILRSGGNGAPWVPGDFGFLDPAAVGVDPSGPCAGKSGANLYTCLTAAEGALTRCIRVEDGISTEPGQKNGVAEASFNVRFDIFRASMNGERTDVRYAPAPNVTKGGNGSCGPGGSPPPANSIALPRDTCLASGTCPNPRFGNGTWDRDGYITRNHNGVPLPSAPDALPALAGTRYQMYLDEIAARGGPGARTPILPDISTTFVNSSVPLDCTVTPRDPRCTRWTTGGGGAITVATESGRPFCSPHQSTDLDRRVIIVAGVDCAAAGISGAKSNVAVQEFFRVFLTEPARDDGANPPNVDMTGEIIGSAGRLGSSGIFRDVVQLYR